jgi:hypothetical protein
MTTSHRISPSDVARYFFHDCERFLRFRTSSKAEKAASGIPDHDFDRSLLMRAILESGCRWEEEVVTRLLNGNVHIAPGDGDLNLRRFTFDETIALLSQLVGRRLSFRKSAQIVPRQPPPGPTFIPWSEPQFMADSPAARPAPDGTTSLVARTTR